MRFCCGSILFVSAAMLLPHPTLLATAIYSVHAASDITLTGFLADGTPTTQPSGLTISGNTLLALDSTATTAGGAVSTILDLRVLADDHQNLHLGDGLRQAFSTTGTAFAGGDVAKTTLFTDGRFEVANATPWEMTVDFLLNYNLSVQVTAENPAVDQATAEAAIEVHWDATSSAGDEQEIVFDSAAVSSLSEKSAITKTDRLTFSITIPSGATGHLLVSFVDGSGYAENTEKPKGVPDASRAATSLLVAFLVTVILTHRFRPTPTRHRPFPR